MQGRDRLRRQQRRRRRCTIVPLARLDIATKIRFLSNESFPSPRRSSCVWRQMEAGRSKGQFERKDVDCMLRVCVIESIDGSNITAYCVHECDSASRMGSRSRQYVITGHSNGSIQVPSPQKRISITIRVVSLQLWDLATALELHRNRADEAHVGGPTSEELLGLMQDCDLSMSRVSSTVPSRANSERSLVGLMPLQQSSSFSLSAYVGGGGGSQANLRQSPSDVVFNHVPPPVSPLGLRLTSSSPPPTVQCPAPKEESGGDDDDDCSGEQVNVNESEEEKEVVVSYCSALQEDESSVTITFFKPEKRDSESDEEGEKVGGGNTDEEDILNINAESLC